MEYSNTNHKNSFVITTDKRSITIWIEIVLLTLPHFNPDYFNTIGVLGDIVDAMRLFSAIIVIILFILKKQTLSRISVLICLQQSFVIFSTIINKGLVVDEIKEVASIICIILIYEVFYENFELFLNAELFCFEVMIYANFLSILLYPDGMYSTYRSLFVSNKCWFLGFYNNLIMFFIPAIMFAMLYSYKTGRKIRSFILIVCVSISSLIVWSGGLIVAIAAIGIIWFFFSNWTLIFNYFTYWISQLGFVFMFVLSGINYGWVLQVINKILNKSNSLQGRIKMWLMYIKYISDKLWIGHGFDGSTYREKLTGLSWGVHAHNLVLEILYRCGIIGLILFTLVVFSAGKRVFKYKDERINKIISTCFAGWCIDSFVEPFMSPFLMGMFVIAYIVNTKNPMNKNNLIS